MKNNRPRASQATGGLLVYLREVRACRLGVDVPRPGERRNERVVARGLLIEHREQRRLDLEIGQRHLPRIRQGPSPRLVPLPKNTHKATSFFEESIASSQMLPEADDRF